MEYMITTLDWACYQNAQRLPHRILCGELLSGKRSTRRFSDYVQFILNKISCWKNWNRPAGRLPNREERLMRHLPCCL